jgi:ribosomal protein L7/L12
MNETLPRIGFSYFTSPNYQLHSQLSDWLPIMKDFGASSVIFQSDFLRAIPEDAFIISRKSGIKPIVHFTSELPKARDLKKTAILVDIYKKRGVEEIIFGDRPNLKGAWPTASWHDKNLVEHFLDRFIPLASYAVQQGIRPVFPPLQPGGDFWDTSFIDLAISSLKNRKLESILQNLILSSFGYTFGKPLSWGMGGPERWTGAKPYQLQDGQEDQLGFNNFEWVKKIAERNLGFEVPVIILEAGFHGKSNQGKNKYEILKSIKSILTALGKGSAKDLTDSAIKFPASVLGCYFSLEKIRILMDGHLPLTQFFEIFELPKQEKKPESKINKEPKIISHYLLLPSHAGSVSDVVLNKVRPIIKKYKPAVGFSLFEASFAQNVSIFPDPILFTEEKINQLRSAGCKVEILPDSGIEIATRLQGS